MNLTLRILNEKSEYVKTPSPLAYTGDVKEAYKVEYPSVFPTDMLADDMDARVLPILKQVVTNDVNPDQMWTLMFSDEHGNPYYRIDIEHMYTLRGAHNSKTTHYSDADNLCDNFKSIIYDNLLDIFGAATLKGSVTRAVDAASGSVSASPAPAATGAPSDEIEKLVQAIRQSTQTDIVKPKDNMSDYVCESTLKEQLMQIVDFFDNRKAYADAGIDIPKGVLFKGPPGTGKTYAARCIAGTVDCYFMSCTASSLQGMYIGSGASNIKAVFKGARTLAEKSGKGVIVFMDEIDSVGTRGTASGAGDEVNRTINQLLAEMSGFDSEDNVMVMAATNFPELLDPALLRSGRFSRQVTIDYPDETQREAMLKHYSSKLKLPIGYDLAEATALTKTFTPADIKEVVNSAAIKAVRAKSSKVSLDDLNESINEVITKDIRKPDNAKMLALVTAHECGHVLMEVLLKNTVPTKVTNYAYGGAGGFTQQSDVLTGLVKGVDIINEVKMLLGGRAAEQVCMGYVTTGASNDLEKAKALLKKYYSTYNFKPYDVKGLDQKVVDSIEELYKETLDALKANKSYLNDLADELSKSRVLYSSDIAMLVAPLLTAKKGMRP